MKRTLVTLTILVVASFTMGSKCGVHPGPTPIEPKDTKYCPDACARLTALGCPEAEPLEDGTTCEQFCVDTQKSGHALRPLCVMDITDCSQLEKCSGPPREVFE